MENDLIKIEKLKQNIKISRKVELLRQLQTQILTAYMILEKYMFKNLAIA